MSYLFFAKVVKTPILINITADADAQNNHWIDIAPRKTSTLANLIAVVPWYWPILANTGTGQSHRTAALVLANIPSHCCRKWQFPGSKRMLSRTTINQTNKQTNR